jgi:hypothetical protein
MGRALAESLMTATCTVRDATGEPVTDAETGEVTPGVGATVYSGKCRVRPAGESGSTISVGGGEAFTFDYLVSIPFAAAGVTERHRVTIDASPDPALVGVELEVQRVARGDDITARRLACTEVA